jgi:hypothetical protein
LRIAAVGVACSIAVFLLGRLAEIAVLGGDEAGSRARVQSSVRASFDSMARELRLMALGLADPDTVVAASEGDPLASRRLFAAADGALAQAQGADYALTAYATDGRPLAWDGRPSELPVDRVQGEEAWFFARGALGLRLVYVTPVMTVGGEPVGAIAAERSLDQAMAPPTDPDVLRYRTRVAPVSIELRFEGARTRPDATAFEVLAPSGARLLTPSMPVTLPRRAVDGSVPPDRLPWSHLPSRSRCCVVPCSTGAAASSGQPRMERLRFSSQAPSCSVVLCCGSHHPPTGPTHRCFRVLSTRRRY